MDALESILAQAQDDDLEPAQPRPSRSDGLVQSRMPSSGFRAVNMKTESSEDILMEDVDEEFGTEDPASDDETEDATDSDSDEDTNSDSDDDSDSDDESDEDEHAPRFTLAPGASETASNRDTDSSSDLEDIPAVLPSIGAQPLAAPAPPPRPTPLQAPPKEGVWKCWNCHIKNAECVGGSAEPHRRCQKCDRGHRSCEWQWDANGPAPRNIIKRLKNRKGHTKNIKSIPHSTPVKQASLYRIEYHDNGQAIVPGLKKPYCRRCWSHGTHCVGGNPDADPARPCEACTRQGKSCSWDVRGLTIHNLIISREGLDATMFPGSEKKSKKQRAIEPDTPTTDEYAIANIPPCRTCNGNGNVCVGGDRTTDETCTTCRRNKWNCTWDLTGSKPHVDTIRREARSRTEGPIRVNISADTLRTRKNVPDHLAHINPCRRCYSRGHPCHGGSKNNGEPCYPCYRAGKGAHCNWDSSGIKAHPNTLARAARRAAARSEGEQGSHVDSSNINDGLIEQALNYPKCRMCYGNGTKCTGGSAQDHEPCAPCSRRKKPCSWDLTGANPWRGKEPVPPNPIPKSISFGDLSTDPDEPFRIESDILRPGAPRSRPQPTFSSIDGTRQPASFSSYTDVGDTSLVTSSERTRPPGAQDPTTKCRYCAQRGHRCTGGDKTLSQGCDRCALPPSRACNWDLSNTTFAYGKTKGHSVEPEDEPLEPEEESDELDTILPSVTTSTEQQQPRTVPSYAQDPNTKCRYCAQNYYRCRGGDKELNRACDRCVGKRHCNWDLSNTTFASGTVKGRSFSPPETREAPPPTAMSSRDPRPLPPGAQDPSTKCRYCAQEGHRCKGGDKETDRACNKCSSKNRHCNWDLSYTTFQKNHVRGRSFSPPRERQSLPAAAAPVQQLSSLKGGAQDPTTKCRFCAQQGFRCVDGDAEKSLGCKRCALQHRTCDWSLEGTTFYKWVNGTSQRGRSIDRSEKRMSLPASFAWSASAAPQAPIPASGKQDPLTKCRRCAQKCYRCLGGDSESDKGCNACAKDGKPCNWDLSNTTFYGNHRNGRSLSPSDPDYVTPATLEDEAIISASAPPLDRPLAPGEQDPRTKCRYCAQLGYRCQGPSGVDCQQCTSRKRPCSWDLTGVKYYKAPDKKPGKYEPAGTAPVVGTKRKRELDDETEEGGRRRGGPSLRRSTLLRNASDASAFDVDQMDIADNADIQDEDQDEQDRSLIITLRVPRGANIGRSDETARALSRLPRQSSATVISARLDNDRLDGSTMVNVGGSQVPLLSGNDMNMEDWEVAPGRIRASQSAAPENIAFSNSFLTSGQAVPVDNNITFKVENILPGRTTKFEPLPRGVRMCSLASGKLRVRFKGEEEFVIGRHGMIRIAPGVECVVENRMYIEATLHITCVQGR